MCVAEELGFSEQQPAIQATAEAVRANRNLQSDGERHVATGGVQRSESGNLLIQQLIGFEQAGEPRRKILVVQVNGRFDQLERGVVAVLFQLAGLGQRAGGFCGQSVADLLNPFEDRQKTVRGISGLLASGWYGTELWSGNWANTSAITTITLLPLIGANFVAGCRFSLYGTRIT